MKKYLQSILILTILLVVPALSLADGPTLTALKITATSVTLNSTGLNPNQYYRFEFMAPADILKSQVMADATGNASSSFSQLSPNVTYTVNLVAYDSSTGVETSSGAPTLIFKTSSPNVSGYSTDVIGGSGFFIPTSTSTITSTKSNTSTSATTLTPATSTSASSTSTNNATVADTAKTSSTSSVSTASSSGGLVPCDNTNTKCNFAQLMNLINNVIHFILFDMVIPIAAIMFAYAGFLLITAGGEIASARTKAKSIFLNAFIGLIIAAAAWLIISTILHIVGYDGSWIGLKLTS